MAKTEPPVASDAMEKAFVDWCTDDGIITNKKAYSEAFYAGWRYRKFAEQDAVQDAKASFLKSRANRFVLPAVEPL